MSSSTIEQKETVSALLQAYRSTTRCHTQFYP